MPDFYCGLDLGQVRDPTALAVVSYSREYLEARNKRDEIVQHYARLASQRGFESVDQLSPKLRSEREQTLEANPLPEKTYVTRHLQRFPLRTPYREVVAGVRRVLERPPLKGNYRLAVDATGVGVAVTDMLTDAGLRFRSVTITGGERESRDGDDHRVPKRNLISKAQVLLQNRRLKVVPSLAEAAALTQELTNFRYKISPGGHDSYEAWREGDHDDLVLALSLAVWLINENYVEIPEGLVETFDVFGDPDFDKPGGRYAPLFGNDGFEWAER